MFISLPLLIGGGALLVLLLVLALRGRRGRDDLMGLPRSGGASSSKPSLALRQPADPMPKKMGSELEAAVRALIAKGRKLEAIKQVRDGTGLGLKEAKDAVEAMGG